MVLDTGLEKGRMTVTTPRKNVNIRQLFTIIYRRIWLVLGVTSLVMSVATILSIVVKPMRESSMQILVSSKIDESTKTSNHQNNFNNGLTDSTNKIIDYTAPLQLMRSQKIITRAVKMLSPLYPDITVEEIKGEKRGKAPLTITQLQKGVGINKLSSQVFEVSFKDKNPVKAQKVVEALQIVYQNFSQEREQERLSKELVFLNEKLPEIQEKLVQSETNLQRFRKKHNIIDPQAQSKIILESIAGLKKEFETITAQLQDIEARYNHLERQIAASSQNDATVSSRLSKSTRYQSLLDEIQKTELALAEQRQRFTDNSPIVQKLLEKHQSQLALLEQENERSLAGKADIGNRLQPLVRQAQLAGVDSDLVQDFIKLQTEALGLRANQQSLIESEKRLRSQLNQYPALIAEYNRLLPEVETNRKTLAQLMEVRESLTLRIARGGFDWQILQEPELVTPKNSSRFLFLLAGAVIAPTLGIALALLLELFNDTIYNPGELTKFTNLRLLGKIPRLRATYEQKNFFNSRVGKFRSSTRSHSSFFQTIVNLPSHETLDMVYQNIQISKHPQHSQSLMITSVLAGEGKSTLTLGLAVSAAKIHQRVLVIDANLRNPCLHSILELSNDWGLSLILLEEISSKVDNYLQPIHPTIDVLTAGPVPDDTIKLLSSSRMKELLERFTSNYDLVIIDASSISNTVDARILASLCSSIILVGRMGKIKHSELIQATEILNTLNLTGIVANEASKSQRFDC